MGLAADGTRHIICLPLIPPSQHAKVLDSEISYVILLSHTHSTVTAHNRMSSITAAASNDCSDTIVCRSSTTSALTTFVNSAALFA